jgi:hypothetical protein
VGAEDLTDAREFDEAVPLAVEVPGHVAVVVVGEGATAEELHKGNVLWCPLREGGEDSFDGWGDG